MQLNRSLPLSGSGREVDRVYPLTRIIAAIIIPFLVAAFVILYFFPGQSGARFAWEIKPSLTAAWMGAGYLGGAYFFVRVITDGRWHRVSAGFWSVTVFTWAMLAATFLHWSRFDLTHFPFQLWLVLYVITPFLVPYLWWRNRATDNGAPEGDDVVVPGVARLGMGLLGGFLLFCFLIAFVVPDLAISYWPWTLTPLTARVLGGWFGLMGIGGVLMGHERRWSGWRIGVESIIFVWHGLMLIGSFLYRADFKPGGRWFMAIEAAAIIMLLGFYIFMERQRRKSVS